VSVLWGMNSNDSAHLSGFEYVGREEFIEQLNKTVHGYRPPESELQGKKILGSRGGRHRHRSAASAASTAATASGTANESRGGGSSDEDLLQRALKIYPPRHVGEGPDHLGNNAAYVAWFNSDISLCGSLRGMRLAAKAVSAGGKAFLYRFDWFFQSTTTCIADSNYHNPISGSNHCDEMTFVFGQPIFDNQDPPGYSYTNCSDPESAYYDKERCTGCEFNEKEAKFSEAMGAYWASFAATGQPSNGDVEWPAFTQESRQNIVLHPEAIKVEADMGRSAACDLWDEVERRYPPHH